MTTVLGWESEMICLETVPPRRGHDGIISLGTAVIRTKLAGDFEVGHRSRIFAPICSGKLFFRYGL